MAVVVYPLDAISGAPSYTGRMLRETVAPLLGGATASRPLGVRSGVRPGTSVTTVTLSSLAYSIAEFAGVVDAESAGEAGPYLFANNSVATGNLNAQDASNPRLDSLVLQISDNAEDGLGTAGGAFVYTAGNPAASPALPTQPARSILLATFAVPKVGAGSPTVTWVAPYLSAAGAPVLALTKAMLDTISGSRVGELGVVFNDTTTSNNVTYAWNGTIWQIAAGAVPGFSVNRGATQAIPASTHTLVNSAYASPALNVGFTSFTSGVLTVATAGWYRVDCNILWPATATAIAAQVLLNSTTPDSAATVVKAYIPNGQSTNMSKLVKLAAGDVLRVYAYTTSAQNLGTNPNDVDFSVEWVRAV